MPGRSTIARWLANVPEFGTQYIRARAIMAETFFHNVVQLAHDTNPVTAIADSVAFKAFTWAAARCNPNVYGDRVEHKHVGQVDHRHIHRDMTPQEAMEIYGDMVRAPLALPAPDDQDQAGDG